MLEQYKKKVKSEPIESDYSSEVSNLTDKEKMVIAWEKIFSSETLRQQLNLRQELNVKSVQIFWKNLLLFDIPKQELPEPYLQIFLQDLLSSIVPGQEIDETYSNIATASEGACASDTMQQDTPEAKECKENSLNQDTTTNIQPSVRPKSNQYHLSRNQQTKER